MEKELEPPAVSSRDGSENGKGSTTDVEKGVVNESGLVVDVGGHKPYTEEEERRVVRKLDWAILPLVSVKETFSNHLRNSVISVHFI